MGLGLPSGTLSFSYLYWILHLSCPSCSYVITEACSHILSERALISHFHYPCHSLPLYQSYFSSYHFLPSEMLQIFMLTYLLSVSLNQNISSMRAQSLFHSLLHSQYLKQGWAPCRSLLKIFVELMSES